MEIVPPAKVAIVGAGRGGRALLDLFHQIPSIEIVGITDRDPQAYGLQLAREYRIPVTTDVSELIRNPAISLILDVTGDPSMESFLRTEKPAGTELLSGSASRLLWQIIQYESALHAELMQTEKLAEIGSFATGIAHDINNPLQLIMGLAENLVDETDLKAIQRQAQDIIEAVRRTSAICRDLTQYARKTSTRDDAMVPLNNRLDEALKIARYATSFHEITVHKSYQDGVEARGNPDEVLHVLVNL